jgi:hypothetical protein
VPRRQDLPAFALPATPRRETRQDLAPRWCSLAELSSAVTSLRFLDWPLIRDPLPYAGGQPKRSAPFPAKETHERTGGKQTKDTPHQATRGIPVNPASLIWCFRCGRVNRFRPLSPYGNRRLSCLRPERQVTPAAASFASSLAPPPRPCVGSPVCHAFSPIAFSGVGGA